MEIDIKSCEITFDLDTPVEVSREGGFIPAQAITFRKPNRKSGPMFQNLVSMYNRAVTGQMAMLADVAPPEELEKAKANAEAKKNEKEETDGIKSLQNITSADIEEEVEGMLVMSSAMDFDFEKGQKLFDKILLSGDKRYAVCSLAGKPITDTNLDHIDYQDQIKMMMVYISFFGKPAKSGTTKDSELPPESATSVKVD